MNSYTLDEIYVGQKASVTKTITKGDIYTFAGLVDDYSPVHVNKEFGEKSPFGQCIAHGFLSGSLFSTLAGNYLPGAGSLYVDAAHTRQVMDGPDFPEVFKPLATNMGKALDELRRRDDVKWTYISPAGDFQADGERTGKYIQAGEELTLNGRGESIISYADYAIALVDEAVSGAHPQARISVVGE